MKGSIVTGSLTASVVSNEDATQLWQMRLGHASEKSIQALAKLLKGVKTCKLKFCKHYVLSKKNKVKFGTVIYCIKDVLNYVHTDVWGLSKNASIRRKHYFFLLLMTTIGGIR